MSFPITACADAGHLSADFATSTICVAYCSRPGGFVGLGGGGTHFFFNAKITITLPLDHMRKPNADEWN